MLHNYLKTAIRAIRLHLSGPGAGRITAPGSPLAHGVYLVFKPGYFRRLLGLAAFAAERRTKEIGVRKVLGASVASVVTLLSREFARLVLLANLVAWPLAYLVMRRWLNDFASRIDIDVWSFALVGGLALVVALLTVSLQALKAAVVNPVKSLRFE